MSKFAFVMGSELLTPQERSILEMETMPVGTVFQSNGVMLRCVLRSDVGKVRDACIGCYYSQNYLTCPKSQCSSMGRTDGNNVWFVYDSPIEQ